MRRDELIGKNISFADRLQTLNRKEAAILRRTLDRPRSASSDISDGEDLKKIKQKVYICIYGTIAIFNGYTDICLFFRMTTEVGQNGNVLYEK